MPGLEDEDLGSSIAPTILDIEKVFKMYGCEKSCKSLWCTSNQIHL